jgi:hypothetical protein
MIRKYLTLKCSVDCTMWSDADYRNHYFKEGAFDEIAYSVGTYGRNGLVMKGRTTGTFYVVPSRSSALFCFNW